MVAFLQSILHWHPKCQCKPFEKIMNEAGLKGLCLTLPGPFANTYLSGTSQLSFHFQGALSTRAEGSPTHRLISTPAILIVLRNSIDLV